MVWAFCSWVEGSLGCRHSKRLYTAAVSVPAKMFWAKVQQERVHEDDKISAAEKGYGTISISSKPWIEHARPPGGRSRPDGPRWMSLLDDDTALSALTIPGTHDSAAFTHNWPFVSTQRMDISNQLNAGIRYFDLRCGIRDDIVELVHGPTFLGLTLKSVLNAMYVWLASHPSEALIVQIKRDREAKRSTVQFAQAIFTLISHQSTRWRTANTIPSVGALRGRIQLFRRFDGPNLAYGLNVSEWQDNAVHPFTIHTRHNIEVTIQDHYSFSDPEGLPSLITKKGGDVSGLLDLAASDQDSDHWYINFTSAYEFNLYYQLTPREVATGGWWGFRWIDGINVRLREYLRESEAGKRRFGVVAMDFPELGTEDLINALILSNFDAKRPSRLRHYAYRMLILGISLLLLVTIWTRTTPEVLMSISLQPT